MQPCALARTRLHEGNPRENAQCIHIVTQYESHHEAPNPGSMKHPRKHAQAFLVGTFLVALVVFSVTACMYHPRENAQAFLVVMRTFPGGFICVSSTIANAFRPSCRHQCKKMRLHVGACCGGGICTGCTTQGDTHRDFFL